MCVIHPSLAPIVFRRLSLGDGTLTGRCEAGEGDMELFGKRDLPSMLRDQRKKMLEAIRNSAKDKLKDRTYWAVRFRVNPLEIDEAGITTRGRHDENRVDFIVPFTGDRELFDCQPSAMGSPKPQASYGPGHLYFEYRTQGSTGAQIKERFQKELNWLKQYLEWSRQDVDAFNAELEKDLGKAIADRLAKLDSDDALMKDLGYPESGKERG